MIVDDVDAADKCEAVIDQCDLSMQAAQQSPLGSPPSSAPKYDDVDAMRSEPRYQRVSRRQRPEAVHQYMHGNAALRRGRQCIADFSPHIVELEDVRLEIDRLGGRVDRVQQAWKVLLAVFQQVDPIAREHE